MHLRILGNTGIKITPVAMGCWPIAGVTSIDVSEANSLATLEAAVDAGINHFDTAYCYGYAGESERMIARALSHRRDEIVIASKGGIHWETDASGKKTQGKDGSPKTLKQQCETSLQRLGTDRVELYYLHAPDPKIPIEESAGAIKELWEEGKILSAGVSNVNLRELQAFAAVCPLSAYQPHYNMLQREIEAAELPWCVENHVSVLVYWPLMKGLLAGKLARDHEFDPKDGRRKYPMFHGTEWQKNQDFLDELRPIAEELNKPLAEVIINWTIHRPGITAALSGAKRPDQIRESAAALTWVLSAEQTRRINQAIQKRGEIVSRSAV
jgi:aryl-alcohol dehydrogenase-like predicted oxidoreductase